LLALLAETLVATVHLIATMIVKSLDRIMDTPLASVVAFKRSGVHMSRRLKWFFLLLLSSLLSACGYNNLQAGDEQIKASWAEVVNQYQRRADLVPNLVSTVKGYAAHEREVLTQVTEARARVGSLQLTPEVLNDPQAFARFQAAQGQLSGALSRLLLISENYPQLKADASFRDLQAQLEGTENRITVARNRYIKAVQDYNVIVRSFPTNLTAMVFGMKVKPNFTVENESAISNAPPVDFSAPARK
jgi:LemA protein